ncbi:hypothetical protein JCM3774_003371 [Rhodotorula dairenensis]
MDEAPLVFAARWRRDLQLLTASLPPGSDRTTAAAESVKTLVLELNQRARDLPAYELQKCQRELEAVQKALSESAAIAAPKPRFAFKRKTPAATASDAAAQISAAIAPTANTTTTAAAGTVGPPSVIRQPAIPSTGAPDDDALLTLTNRTGAYLSRVDLPTRSPHRRRRADEIVPSGSRPEPEPEPEERESAAAAATASQCLALVALSQCVVDLLDSQDSPSLDETSYYSAVYLADLEDSLVLLPENQQRGSILVQNCRRCFFVLGGHQIRIHDSEECWFFLAAGSQPVIERCRELAFAPYPLALQGLSTTRSASTSRLDVQDFDDPFATAARPSLNWRHATEAERATLDVELVRWRTAAGSSREEEDARRSGATKRLLQSVLVLSPRKSS